jgi:hypothetical protein
MWPMVMLVASLALDLANDVNMMSSRALHAANDFGVGTVVSA